MKVNSILPLGDPSLKMEQITNWVGFAILCEPSHSTRAAQYIQEKYPDLQLISHPPSKDGVLVFTREIDSSKILFCSSKLLWIEQVTIFYLKQSERKS